MKPKNWKIQNEVRAKRPRYDRRRYGYIEEYLRSPCTQEIAVFKAFAEIVDKADKK